MSLDKAFHFVYLVYLPSLRCNEYNLVIGEERFCQIVSVVHPMGCTSVSSAGSSVGNGMQRPVKRDK